MLGVRVVPTSPSNFWKKRDGVAAIEFAAVFPLLFLLLAGAFELSRAVMAARQLTSLADSAATMIASDSNGVIYYTDLHYAYDSAMITFPRVLSDSFAKNIPWSSDITISLAGITFSPTVSGCTVSCSYKASVVWTGGASARKCGSTIQSASDSNAPTPTTLPSDLFTPIPNPNGGYNSPPFTVVADITYTWTPILFSRFFGNITLQRSAYVNARYASKIVYTKASGDDGFGAECSGY